MSDSIEDRDDVVEASADEQENEFVEEVLEDDAAEAEEPAGDDDPLGTPAERWGVATAFPRILVCGSGARRGGAVSGIGGHNAAMAAGELLDA